MFLTDPERTPYDLNWTMWGIPVRVHPFFWLFSLFLGWSWMRVGIEYLLLWVACVFLSILVHELGHVVMGMYFGQQGHIVLYSFGGLAIGSGGMSNRWQRVAVCFAGPGAGFLFIGVIGALVSLYDPGLILAPLGGFLEGLGIHGIGPDRMEESRLLCAAISNLFFINVLWGLINLLPVFPLDGGQISREICTHYSAENGVRLALQISLGVAAFMAINTLLGMADHPLVPFLAFGGMWTAIMFGLLAFSSYQALQQISPRGRGDGSGSRRGGGYWDRDEPQRAPWERDPDWWKRG